MHYEASQFLGTLYCRGCLAVAESEKQTHALLLLAPTEVQGRGVTVPTYVQFQNRVMLFSLELGLNQNSRCKTPPNLEEVSIQTLQLESVFP